ncbi:MAG: amino acid ABC transporter substrate-binding protein, partial [Pseudomonadota bacterium]|nr:amino acid ABC transporter substrate-binding protein [Pseudomonadota bacterium]
MANGGKKPPVQVEHQEEVKMNKSVFLGALTVAGIAAGAAAAGTLDDVKARGKLNCGVTTG